MILHINKMGSGLGGSYNFQIRSYSIGQVFESKGKVFIVFLKKVQFKLLQFLG